MSPWPGPPRPSITLRMGVTLLRRVDAWALAHGLVRSAGGPNRSEAINRLVKQALDDNDAEIKGQTR